MRINFKLFIFFFAISLNSIFAQYQDYNTLNSFQREIIYFDDFTYDMGLKITNDGISSGSYHYKYYQLSSNSAGYIGTLPIKEKIDENRDFQIEATIKFVEGQDNNGNGIIWGKSNDSWANYFIFSFTGNGSFSINKRENSNFNTIVPWTNSSYIRLNEENKLSINKLGSNYYFFINEKFVHQCQLPSFYGQELYLFSNSNSTIHITNISISYLKENSYKKKHEEDEDYNKTNNSDISYQEINQSDFTYNEIPPGVQLISNEDDWLKYSPIKACCCYPDFSESNKFLGVLYNYKAYEKIKLYLKNSNSNVSVANKTEWENIFSQIKSDVDNVSKLQLNYYPGYFDQTWYSPTTKTASYWIDENTAVTFSADTYGEPMIDENIINDNESKRQSLAAFSIRIIKSTTNLCDFDKWHKENINVRGNKNQIKFITNLSDWNLYSPTQPCCCYINFDLNNDSYGFIYNQLAYEFLKNDTDLKEKGYRVALDSDWNSLLECVKNNNDYSSLYNCNSDNFNGLNLIPNGFYDNGFWTQFEQSKCRYWSGDNYMVNTIQFNCSKMNEINKIDLSNRRTAAYMIRFIKL